MRFVSPFLKNVLYPSLSAAGVFRRAAGAGLAIVTFHGVLPPGYESVDAGLDGNLVSAEMLRRQLRLLKARYNVISPEQMLAWREGRYTLPPRAVLLTCDDGLLNNLTDMLPILREESVHCLFFVTGSSGEEARTMLWYEDLLLIFLGAPVGRFEISCEGFTLEGELKSREERRALWWDAVKRLSRGDAKSRALFLQAARKQFESGEGRGFGAFDEPSCRRFGLMTRGELRELASAGMTIGAHTMSHPMLSQTSPELANAEIVDSRSRLESALEKSVWAFAYPFGDAQSVTPQVLAMPKQAGYEAAFLNFGGGMGTDLPPYALPRVHVTADMNLGEFDAHVSGFYAWLQRRAGR